MAKLILSGSVISLIVVLICCSWYSPSPPVQPNVLLILADDMGYGDVANAGNPYLRTPNLDRLARSGVQFTNFYVSPVCAPTRASLLTGRYHQRTQVRSVTNGYEMINPEEKTIAEYLQAEGYRTAIFGKWHLGEYYPSLPNAQGFDEYLGFRTGHTDHYYHPTLEHNGRPVTKQGHITDVLTDEAIGFMQQDPSAPFFCYLAYNAPHTPLQVDSSWWKPYLDQGLEERTARIYGLIEHLDQNLGRVLDQLAEEDVLEETIIIFMSDNGPISGWRVPQEKMRYNAGLRDQKFTIYDGGIRTQAYWSWAGHWPKNKTIATVGAHIDVLPTLLDIIGISKGEHDPVMDGVSLQEVLVGTSTELDKRLVFQNYDLNTLPNKEPYPGGIVRMGPWKMVNGTQLFNLDVDPGETTDLASQKSFLFGLLKDAYAFWWKDVLDQQHFGIAPIPIGYQEAKEVALQPHHAKASGKLSFIGQRGLLGERTGSHPSGVDGDWLSDWQRKGDQALWQVEFVQAGQYEIGIQARYQQRKEPIELRVQVGSKKFAQRLPQDPVSNSWAYYRLGQLEVPLGKDSLSLTLSKDLPRSSFEIKELVVKMQ